MEHSIETANTQRHFVQVTLVIHGEWWRYEDLNEFMRVNDGFIFSRSDSAMSIMLFTDTPVEELQAQVMTAIDPEQDACSVDLVARPQILLPIAESMSGWLRIRTSCQEYGE